MAETQRHEGEFEGPPTRHRAPVQHAMNEEEKQPGGSVPLVKQIFIVLGNLLCLAAAVYYLWLKQDLLSFLILVGVGTGQIPIWRAIGHLDGSRGRSGPLREPVPPDREERR